MRRDLQAVRLEPGAAHEGLGDCASDGKADDPDINGGARGDEGEEEVLLR